jgi:glutathione S-transferase
MKKVPAIVDPSNQLYLGESHAIVNYLIRKFKLE